MNSNFIKTLPSSVQDEICSYGLRNIGLNTIAPTGCLHKDTMVISDKGILKLDEIYPYTETKGWGNYTDSISMVNENNVYNASDKAFINGTSPAKKIVTSSGMEIIGTPDHRIRVIDGEKYVWKSLENLSEKDILPYKIGGYTNKNNPKMIIPETLNKNEKEIHLPMQMDESLAYFLGYYNANGSTHDKGIRIHTNSLNPECRNKIIAMIHDIFNWESNFIDNGRNCSSISYIF